MPPDLADEIVVERDRGNPSRRPDGVVGVKRESNDGDKRGDGQYNQAILATIPPAA